MPLFITRAGTHKRAEISVCSVSIVVYNNPSNSTVEMTASQHSHHAQFHRADTAWWRNGSTDIRVIERKQRHTTSLLKTCNSMGCAGQKVGSNVINFIKAL